MLERLIINNIAIIKDIDITFNNGMNVISGDTGAGKSLIIDSLNLLSGNRAVNSLIRHNEKKAFVKAFFTTDNKELIKYLTDLNIENPTHLEITREIGQNKNIIKVNDTTITLTNLKDIASYLFNIHEQQDTFKLFNEDNYFSYLDNEDKIINKLNEYLFIYLDYKDILKKYEDLLKAEKSSKDKLDYLLYEQKELEELNLLPNEDEEIKSEIEVLKHYDLIFNSLKESYELLDNTVVDNLYEVVNKIDSIANLKEEYNKYLEMLNDIYYNLADIKSDIYSDFSNLDYDDNRLDLLESRSYEIEKIKDKYHKSVNELIEYYNNLNYEIEKITNYDELVINTKKELDNIKLKLYNKAIEIHDLRVKKANNLEKQIIKNCKELDLENTEFKIEVSEVAKLDEVEFSEVGIDKINFLVSFNVGEPLKELNKVASGGELSRLMLAIKAIEAKEKNYSLMVFDEIDTGVSGEAAYKIGKKIKEIANNTQVISITHIARVAAMADYEYLIYKEEKEGHTYAFIKLLDINERVRVIARMIAGNNITSGAILSAKELLGLV